MESTEFTVDLTRESAYHFRVEFDQAGLPALDVDEPPPLGAGAGPSATRLLGSAIGHCLASSLLFCLGKARVEVQDLKVRVTGTIGRNEAGRLRVTRIQVQLLPGIAPEDRDRARRCLEIFQDFCTVTESVRKALEVDVHVEPQPPA